MKLLKVLVLTVLAAAVFWLALRTVPILAVCPRGKAVLLGNHVSAVSLAADELPDEGKSRETAIKQTVHRVSELGADTLYFTVNSASGASLHTNQLPVKPSLQRTAFGGLLTVSRDPLAEVAQSCAQEKVKLVAVLDILALLQAQGRSDLSEDGALTGLQQLIMELQANYALSGICLSFKETLTQTTQTEQYLTELAALAALAKIPLGVELPADSLLPDSMPDEIDFFVVSIDNSQQMYAAAALSRASTSKIWWRCPEATAENLQLFTQAAYNAADSLPFGMVWMPVSDEQDGMEFSALRQTVSEVVAQVQQLSVPSIPDRLIISYPASGETVTVSTLFLMGSCRKGSPVYIDGTKVKDSEKYGVFGMAVTLQPGENCFTVTQSGQTATVQVFYDDGRQKTVRQKDGSVPLPQGSYIRVTDWITSLLQNPDSERLVTDTARQGGVGVVKRSVQTARDEEYTYAYELESGGWIVSSACQQVFENTGPYALAFLRIQSDESGTEKICLVENGTPICYDQWQPQTDTLTVTLANTDPDTSWEGACYPLSQSKSVKDVTLQSVTGGVQLTFRLVSGALWGYDVCYQDGNTVLLLTQGPTTDKNIADCAQPLQGVCILLDPGHGGQQKGALGIAGGIGGPCESELNLAVAKAAAMRLRQLGAKVTLTREEDETLSLEQRSRMLEQQRPDLFVSLHHNSIELTGDGNTATGTSAYYFTLSGKKLADALCEDVSGALTRENDGASWAIYYVIRNTYTPAVLLELGFLVNPAEYAASCEKDNILLAGDGVAQGILRFFSENVRTVNS